MMTEDNSYNWNNEKIEDLNEKCKSFKYLLKKLIKD